MKAGQAGYSLTESVIAVLVLGIVASAIGGLLFSNRKMSDASYRKQLASGYAAQLRDVLKNYVIAAGAGVDPAAGDLAALDQGMRGYLGCLSNCQKLPSDGCTWALQAGCTHDAGALLPTWFKTDPWRATMLYHVTPGLAGRGIKIDVHWEESGS